jgi:hypothetical protein
MRYIKEDLGLARQEISSKASAQAQQLKLSYVGFGRYEDPKTNQVTHIVQDDRLVPFRKAVRTNSFKEKRSDDIGGLNKHLAPGTDALASLLVGKYPPEKYKDNEMDAIWNFTNDKYVDVNDRLTSLPLDVGYKQIEPISVDDQIPNIIAAMDTAINKSRAPQEFITYTKLGPDYNVQDFQPGMAFRFKGYRDTTINLESLTSSVQDDQLNSTNRNQMVVLQITVKKNTKGIYADNFSATPGSGEFILPRGAKIDIVSGPNKLVGSDAATNNMNMEIVYFECITKG